MLYIWLREGLLHGLRLSKCFESGGCEKAKSCGRRRVVEGEELLWAVVSQRAESVQEHGLWPVWLK